MGKEILSFLFEPWIERCARRFFLFSFFQISIRFLYTCRVLVLFSSVLVGVPRGIRLVGFIVRFLFESRFFMRRIISVPL